CILCLSSATRSQICCRPAECEPIFTHQIPCPMRPLLKLVRFKAMLVLSGLALLAPNSSPLLGQAPTKNRPWAYQLLDGSSLTDDCLICGRPTIEIQMRGAFSLRLLEENVLFSRYALDNISFTAGSRYMVEGSGTFQIGGEVAVRQQVFLALDITDGTAKKRCYFTNRTSTVSR